MIVNIKLSTGKEIELTLDEISELSNFFKEQNKLNISFPYIPVNPYPIYPYYTTPDIPKFPEVMCKAGF